MIRLSAHIVSLMLKHDCVIVPELGGFVAQYVPARLITAENILMPPCRTVVFNPRLNMNDGLLVQSYMQAYHTGYTETLRMVNAEVKKLKDILAKEGSYELSGIGTLCMQGTDKMLFKPQESGILSPELYGLNTVATTLPTEPAIPSTEPETQPEPVYVFTDEEETLLLKLGMAERGDTDCTECIALVMRTVLNRVESPRFSSTIKGVIYALDQFTPVVDGSLESAVPTECCREALEMIKAGWDESQGALYYEWCQGESWHSRNLKLLLQHCDTRFYQ